MRFYTVFLAIASCSLVAGTQLSIANLTSCGLGCLVVTVPQAGCSLTDSACQCSSQALAQATTACLLQNCTMHDSLVVSKVQASICDLPHENHSNVIIAVNATIVTITSVFVGIRIVTSRWLSGTLGLGDWIIAVALLLSFPATYFSVTMAKEGFGRHLWDLMEGDLLRILRNFYVAENIYVAILGLTKLSVLVFYLGIFPQTWFRNTTYGVIGFVFISTTTISLLTIFQCHPVSYFWNKNIDNASCVNINALAYANSAMSIAQDIIIVALPIPALSKLRLGRRKKIGVIFMFAVGSFGCIISMIRLKSLLSFGNSIDPSWDYTLVVIWTTIELAVAMICACFPSIRRLLVRLYPQAFESSAGYSNKTHPGTNSWYTPPRLDRVAKNDAFVELRHRETPDLEVRPTVPQKDDVKLPQRRVEVWEEP